MSEPLPKFDAPPVVETVLSVQFAPLPGLTSATAGWFWKVYLDKPEGAWSKTRDATPIQDQFENFGPDGGWIPQGKLHLVETSATRSQLIRSDEERMVQIQPSRFILNWKRVTGQYPSYDALLPEYLELLKQFSKFVEGANCGGKLDLNQWEMTYVNHLVRGELWSLFDDVAKIFNGVAVPRTPAGPADTINANWRYLIGENGGRLHVDLNHIRTAPEQKDILRLQFVARGPLTSSNPDELLKCFNNGHEAIVRTFAAITTNEAHRAWKRVR